MTCRIGMPNEKKNTVELYFDFNCSSGHTVRTFDILKKFSQAIVLPYNIYISKTHQPSNTEKA